MNFTVLSPNDTPVQNSQSDMTDARFGGNRTATLNIVREPLLDKTLPTHYITVSGGGIMYDIPIPGEGVYKVFDVDEEDLPSYAKHLFIEERHDLYNTLYNVLVASGVANDYVIDDTFIFYFPGTGDYTHRYGNAPSIEENPTDTAIKDVDDMANLSERKNVFTQEEIRADVQRGNENTAIQSDSTTRPRMDEGTDAVQVPSSTFREQMKKTNRWSLNSGDIYEGEIS